MIDDATLELVDAVFFDAVGTLIEPSPPAAEVYRATGHRFGLSHDLTVIDQRFREAFRAEEDRDAESGWVVHERRERDRWRSIVGRVFPEALAVESMFEELWSHFARPEAWRVIDGVGPLLVSLQRRGLTLGVASNFDGRLHAIVDAVPELAPLTHRIVSSEVGWRKPSPRFFDAVAAAARCPPGRIAFVGDRRDLDFDGANAAGMIGILVHPHAGE